ncbi:MAG: HAD-IA family hydrolase [Bryobacteraceae bacterium]
MSIQLVIFDLDGTLIDSRLDLANAVNATRAHVGLGPLDNQLVYSYVGNGAPELIRRSLANAADDAEILSGLKFFMGYYRAHVLDSTTLFPGVRKSLERLHSAGKRLAVLTNKPEDMSRAIVEGLGVGGYFFRVYGGNSLETRKPDPMGVAALMKEAGSTRATTVMVGDSSVDVVTARNAGIACCAVTYGFQPETLADPAPDLLVGHMEQVAEWILSRS